VKVVFVIEALTVSILWTGLPDIKEQKHWHLSTVFSRQGSYHYKRGTTAVLSSKTMPVDIEEVSVHTVEPVESMDTSA